MRRLIVAVLVALALAPAVPAAAQNEGEQEHFDEPQLTDAQATQIALAHPKVADWLERYPPNPQTEAAYDVETRRWTVKAWSGAAGQIAQVEIDDATRNVTSAYTGPQVAWGMARGGPGAFGGELVNSPLVWYGLSALFFFGLADVRRLLSVRNLDLLVLLSFSVSLWFFNRGDIFTSVPLVYPPLVYLIARLTWLGIRGRRGETARPVWPVWVLAAATIFLAGFRIGLNVQDSNVIDVGFAGVVGAHRIANGEAPYGHMPIEGDLKPCGPADPDGAIHERIQTNGRCERSNERGDTYGPVSYIVYLPGFWIFGWEGKWDELPAAHLTSIAFDLLCMLGLALVGLRFGGTRLAATLAFAWAAYPFTQYASSSNTNDAILPAFLIWGFWLVSSSWARGIAVALAGWTKFAALIVAPLWATYPDRRPKGRFVAGFAAATLASFSILLLEPSLVDAVRTFVERSLIWQIGRESPFSLWDWRQYHAEGIPDFHLVQLVLQVALVIAAVAVAFWPRTKSPFQLAALSGALIAGFELVLTHWFYLYIPWFFPFAALAFLAALPARAAETVREESDAAERRPVLEPAPAG